MPGRNYRGLVLALIAIAVAIIDQASKYVLVAMIGPRQPASRVDIIGRWLALEYVENRGAAFGLLGGLAPLLVVASVAIVLGLLVNYARVLSPPRWQTLALGAIVGGALGNLIDRVRLGFVVDFVSVGPWPNFNVADSAITLGALALAWGWIRSGSVEDAAGRTPIVSR